MLNNNPANTTQTVRKSETIDDNIRSILTDIPLSESVEQVLERLNKKNILIPEVKVTEILTALQSRAATSDEFLPARQALQLSEPDIYNAFMEYGFELFGMLDSIQDSLEEITQGTAVMNWKLGRMSDGLRRLTEELEDANDRLEKSTEDMKNSLRESGFE